MDYNAASPMGNTPQLGTPIPGTTGGLPMQSGLNVTQNPMAQQLQSQGRGEDSMLVHMTPNEVNSLQGLALASGGSLTINPETGLPEAGWLGKLLPTILGAIATPLTGGLINPLTASALIGAGTGIATGSLKKGLLAGIQAYGGAALGSAAGLNAGSFGIGQAANAASTAAGAGAAGGATTAGLINPDEIATGAAIGAALPGIPVVGNRLTSKARDWMYSAVKPTTADVESGAAQRAIETMLEEGVNPTMQRTIFGRGLDTLKEKVGNLNNQIADIIQNSKGNVSKSSVLSYLDDLERKAMQQVNPANDLNAIQKVRDEFISHPLAQGQTIPVQLAQKLKSGTYKAVGAKSYGELGSTATEAQKQLARGLKEEIAIAEPSVAGINAQESSLINALNVSERRALQELNNNPMSLSLLASDPRAAVAFMADKSGAFKALLARMLYRTGQVATPRGGLLNVPAATVGQTNE